jgi:hypothetical protein
VVPEPLVIKDPLVSLAFLYMVAPGIGDYYEFSQIISCFLGDEAVAFRPLMVAENVTAIWAGREILGLPKKYGRPRIEQIFCERRLDRPGEREPVSSCGRSRRCVAGTRNCIGISYLQRQLD